MSKYRKQFLNMLKPIWAERLPEWQPGLCSPSFYTKPEATFTWTRFTAESLIRFHAFIEFSSKSPGMFTCDCFITDASNRVAPKDKLSVVSVDDIPKLRPGVYRIGKFISGLDVWWHLCDEAAESNRFWGQQGLHGLAVLRRKEHDWYAASYDVSPKQIMQEAAEDFTNRFLSHVSPKLFAARAS
jgi:hypothetical protein